MGDMLIAKRKHIKPDGSGQWLPVGMTLWINPQEDGSVRYSISDNRTGERFSCFPMENRAGAGGGQRGAQYNPPPPQPGSTGAPPPHMPGAQPYAAPTNTGERPSPPVPPDVPYGNEPDW